MPIIVPLSQALGINMRSKRIDLAFAALAFAGLIGCVLPELIVTPASAAWRAWTGEVDMVDGRAFLTWLGILLALDLTCLGRIIFLLRHRSPTTRSRLVFYGAWAGLTLGFVYWVVRFSIRGT